MTLNPKVVCLKFPYVNSDIVVNLITPNLFNCLHRGMIVPDITVTT